MFDCHADVLTHIYTKENKIEYLKKEFEKVYKASNIIGGIFNLYYMSKEEMKEELNLEEKELDLIENLKKVDSLIKKHELISNEMQYIYGIEGLDYLEKIEDIDILYELGLRSTGIVWNNKNRFGSGIRGEATDGLTEEGKRLIEKLIDSKIAIDLSHTNEKTFYDIIEVCENNREKNPIVMASHSNSKAVCDVQRNLTDEQIKKIAKLDGLIGVVMIKGFCKKEEDIDENRFVRYEEEYMKHIEHIKELLGNTDNIGLATDDLRYCSLEEHAISNENIYTLESASEGVRELLLRHKYNPEEVSGIIYENFKNKILKKVK